MTDDVAPELPAEPLPVQSEPAPLASPPPSPGATEGQGEASQGTAAPPEPVVPGPQTPHSAPDEPFNVPDEPLAGTEMPQEQPAPGAPAAPAPAASDPAVPPPAAPVSQNIRDLRENARSKKQSLKREKLDKIMTLFEKSDTVANDDVEKLLHVSDATASRYLSLLVKEGRLTRVGATGRSVVYVKT